MPPTRAEICAALGFRSPNAAEEHLRALQRKGAIEMMPGASRGIRVVETMEESERFRDDSAGIADGDGNTTELPQDARSTRIAAPQPVAGAPGQKANPKPSKASSAQGVADNITRATIICPLRACSVL